MEIIHYYYSYSEQIYEPQDFGLERGQIVYVTDLSFRPAHMTSTYNYIAPNFFIGTTTNVYYSSPNTYSFLINSGTPMTKYRTSSTTENSTWNKEPGQFELLSLNQNGNKFAWNTDYNMVVGVYDAQSSYYYSSSYTYCNHHIPARGYTASQYRTIGFNTSTQNYANPESGSFRNYSYQLGIMLISLICKFV
jgi:hypothetical protein